MQTLLKSTQAYRLLQTETQENRLSHAYLLLMNDARNLRVALKTFAKLFFGCSDETLLSASQRRISDLIDADNFSDCLFFPTEGKKLTVEDAERIQEESLLSPVETNQKLFILSDFSEANAQTQNKLLKLLEEPPAKTLFLLVVHQLANVLPTVRSRARVEKMRPLTISQLRELCVKFIPDEDISTETLKLSNGSFGKIAGLKQSGGDEIYAELIDFLNNPRANSGNAMMLAKKIASDTALHGILLDAVAHFGLADMYPQATRAINDIKTLYLEPEIGIFKIIMEIKKCL